VVKSKRWLREGGGCLSRAAHSASILRVMMGMSTKKVKMDMTTVGIMAIQTALPSATTGDQVLFLFPCSGQPSGDN